MDRLGAVPSRTIRINPLTLLIGGAVGLIFLLIFLSLFAPIVRVSTGYVGVETYFGKVTGNIYTEGVSTIHPLSDVVEMDVRIQKGEATYEANSSDNQRVHVHAILNYSLDPKKAPHVYQTIGMDYLARVVDPMLRELVRSEVVKYKATDTLAKRIEIATAIRDALSARTSDYGIMIREVSISEVGFQPEYQKAIEDKQLEEIKVQTRQFVLEQERKNAEIKVAQAKGEADAKKMDADAQAYYNEKTAQTISDKVIAMKYYEKWDGRLPQYMLGENSNVLLTPK